MPKFQQRHYEAIADSINRLIWDTDLNMDELVGIIKTRNQLTKMFQSDNPNFKESKFTDACRKGLTMELAEVNATLKHTSVRIAK